MFNTGNRQRHAWNKSSKKFNKKLGLFEKWFYNLRVASCELWVVSCDFKKINLRVASSYLRVAK